MKTPWLFLATLASAMQLPAVSESSLPGHWIEAENARNHNKSKPQPKASGNSAVGWFEKNRINTFDFQDLGESDNYLYLRYARGLETPGSIEILLGEQSGGEPLARMDLPPTGAWDRFAWARIRLPHLPKNSTGKTTLSLRGSQDSADLDCWGIVRADVARDGLWMPPNEYREGKPFGEATLLPPVSIASITSPILGHLLVSDEGSGTFPIEVELVSNLIKPVQVTLRALACDERGAKGKPIESIVELLAGARKKIPLEIPANGFGHWSAEVDVDAQGEIIHDSTTFAVIRPPHLGLRPNSPFGLSIGHTEADAEIGRKIGVKWRRGIPELFPDTVAPAPGKFWQPSDAEPFRKTVEFWKSKGIETLGAIDYNMSWNVEPDPLGRDIKRHQNRPKDLEAHADMVAAMINPLADIVPNWELWNEPWVHGWTWRTGSAQDYRDLTRLVWDRVKPKHPDVHLIGGGSTPYQRDVVYALGASNTGYMDGTSTHPYGIPDRSTPTPAAIESVLNRKFSISGGVAGIWATEVGTAEFMFDDLPANERPFAVARSVAPVYLLNRLGAGNTPIRLFFFASKYNRQFSGDTFNWWNGRAPKPAVAAFATLTHFLEDSKLVGDLWSDSRVGWALLFKRQGGSNCIALWAEDPYRGTLSLPGSDWQAYDYLGRPVGEFSEGTFRVPFEPMSVIYLMTAKSPEAVAAAFKDSHFTGFSPIDFAPLSFPAGIEERPALGIRLENLTAQPQSARIEASGAGLEFEAQSFRLEPHERRTIQLPFLSGDPSPINRYPVKITTSIGDTKHSRESTLQVATFQPFTPQIDGDLAEWDAIRPVTMVSQGTRDTREIALDPSKAAELLAAKIPGEAALYRLRAAYDEDNLYFAAEIPDSSLATNSTFDDDPNAFPFLADSVLLAFDVLKDNPDDLLRDHPLWEKSLGAEVDYEFCITPARRTAQGPSYSSKPPSDPAILDSLPLTPQLHRLKAPGTNFQTFYPTNPPTQPPLGPMENAAHSVRHDREKGLLTYEFAIPLSAIPELKKRLADGTAGEISFAWAVIDRINGGRGNSYWTQEAGLVREGAYGFSPHWGGGTRRFGGRIITPWTFEPKMPR